MPDESKTNDKASNLGVTPRSEDFSRWYIDIVKKADLIDYTPVRGFIVFKPDGYELWEQCQRHLDAMFKETGHRNAYFPLLIPESFFQKEKDHIEGFNPELPWVTEAGGEKLEERLAIRPTSETMIGYMMSNWIKSYRDLPMLLNQWANIVRWEKRTLPFIRTREFLWQEGHTAHVDKEDAMAETMRMLEVYRTFVEEYLAVPVVVGQKTESEKFAGAMSTYSIEGMMQDGKALQAGTTHYMGTKFAEAFEIKYLAKDNTQQFCHTSSWGVSTRLIGAVIMVHGDDKGLVMPPKVAPTQVIIIPIGPPKSRDMVLERADAIMASLKAAGIRVRMDDRPDMSPGWKFNEYELRGIPIRLELGPRDCESNQMVLASRVSGEKKSVSQDDAVNEVVAMLDQVHQEMWERALAFMTTNFYNVDTLAELKAKAAEKLGFFLAGWCGSRECESQVKDVAGTSSRNMPFDVKAKFPGAEHHEKCVCCGEAATSQVVFAKSY